MYVILLLSTPDGTIRAKMDLFTFMLAYPAIFAQMMDYLLETGLGLDDAWLDDAWLDDALFDGSFGDDFFDDAWLDGGGGTALSDGPPAGFDSIFGQRPTMQRYGTAWDDNMFDLGEPDGIPENWTLDIDGPLPYKLFVAVQTFHVTNERRIRQFGRILTVPEIVADVLSRPGPTSPLPVEQIVREALEQ